jgi:hypothetical protein
MGRWEMPLSDHTSGNLLLLRLQRNRRTYNFSELGIEDPHCLSMIPIVERTRLCPPAQLVQSLSNLIPRRFTSITTFAVWAVEFQEGQQVASQIHDPPQDSGQSPQNVRQQPQVAGTALRRGGRIMPHDGGVDFNKSGLVHARRSRTR